MPREYIQPPKGPDPNEVKIPGRVRSFFGGLGAGLMGTNFNYEQWLQHTTQPERVKQQLQQMYPNQTMPSSFSFAQPGWMEKILRLRRYMGQEPNRSRYRGGPRR
jgi:hypothetical protein